MAVRGRRQGAPGNHAAEETTVDFNLSEKELMLRDTAKQFTSRELEPVGQRLSDGGRLPDDLITRAAGIGLLGLTVPARYGGGEAGHLSAVLVIEQMAYSGSGGWWVVGMNNSVGACIARFASEDIKQECLPALCHGTAYASTQFTEEDTGSDPEALKTVALPRGDVYVISGMKRFSTFGARDGYAILFARDETGGCTAFAVRKNVAGYQAGKQWALMGAGGMEAVDVHLDNLMVPEKNILGRKGAGFSLLLSWVGGEKVFQCAAATGIGQAAIDESVRYAGGRMSRGKPVSAMQGIRWMLADMECRLQAARWLTYRAAFALDGEAAGAGTVAASAKLFVMPAAMEVVDLGRRIHGAYGYTREMKIERLYREVAGFTAIATSMEINKSLVGGYVVSHTAK